MVWLSGSTSEYVKDLQIANPTWTYLTMLFEISVKRLIVSIAQRGHAGYVLADPEFRSYAQL